MNKIDLLAALEAVKPGIASKDIIESMTHFYFSGTHVVSYNDQISIQYPFKTDFSLFVKAKDLYTLLKKTSAPSLNFVEVDGKLQLKARTMNASLASIQDDEVKSRIQSVNKSLRRVKWASLPSNFSECISLCSFAASKVESDQSLTCVHISEKNCTALDNQRVAHAIMDSAINGEMLIKAKEIRSLIALNPTSYVVTKSWVHFRNEKKCIFSIRKVTGDFPECLNFFEFDGAEIELPKSILEGLDLASILVDTIQPTVNITIKEKACFIAVSSSAGKITHKSKIVYKGEALTFNINPSFLKEMMKYSAKVVVTSDRIRLEVENFSLVTALIIDGE